ncbi:MAG: site-specific integrase [Bacteroidota bacterium]|nr:site-specific integrase [Bacteroidota bacterium]
MHVTTKITLYNFRLKKNGKYPVKIRVTWQRKFYFYATGIDLTEDEFKNYHTRKNLKKQFDDIIYFLTKADKIVNDLGRNFSWKEFDTLYYNRKQIISQINNQSQSINIITQLEDYAKKLYGEGSIKTSKGYTTISNHLKEYLKKKDNCLLFSDVTPEFLNLLEKYFLSSKMKLSYSSIGVYMRNMRTIYNQAISKKIIGAELYPFGKGKYVPPSSKKAKKALSIEVIEKIYNYKSENPEVVRAKDMWLFAYFANGLNVKDIAFLRYENIKDGVLSFIRAKTKHSTKDNIQTIEIFITEDIQRIINKWGRKPQRPKSFIFDILHPKLLSDLQIYRDINQAVRTTNKYMKRIAEDLKLNRVPTTNFARHSFSTVLKRAGVSIEMISEQLGHSSIRTTQIYLDSFESGQKREISKFLTSFKSKE